MTQSPSEQDLCLIVAAYAATHLVTTIKLFVSALENLKYRWWGPNATLPRGRLFTDTMRGIQNYYGNVVSTSKAALMLEDLLAFALHLDCRYFEHARDWCACLLAFFGLLRVGEYMGGRLRKGDVKIEAGGVSITIMRSKTSNVPAVVSVTARTDSLCPVKALLDYLAFFPLLRLPQDDGCPLFLSRLRNNRPVIEPMTEADFIASLRVLVRVALPGRDERRYAGHSLRRGGATALALAGVAEAHIQRHGRWTSDAYKAYIEYAFSPAVRLLATRALLPS